MKRNKIIAREILIFVSLIGIICNIFLFQLFQNKIIDLKTKALKQKIAAIQVQIDTLPKDNIKKLYAIVEPNLIKSFKPHNPYNVFPINSVTLKGEKFKYFDEEDLGINVKKAYPAYWYLTDKEAGKSVLQLYKTEKDSIIVIGWVSFDEFRELLKNQIYINHLYVYLSDKVIIGKQPTFDKWIQEGFNYSIKTKELAESLTTRKHQIETTLKETTKYHLDTHSKLYYLFRIGIILAILIYPVRFSYLLVRWSIKTLKTS